MKKSPIIILMSALAVVFVSAGTAFASNSNVELNQSSSEVVAAAELSRKIENYVVDVNDANYDLMQVNQQDFIATITFADYLSFEEFNSYINDHNITVLHMQLRGVQSDGQRVTVFSKVDKGIDEVESAVNRDSVDWGYELRGVISVGARVNSRDLEDIISDEHTYLVDTSGDKYAKQISATAQNSYLANGANEEKSSFPQPLTWDLEDAGILTPKNGDK